MFSMQRVQLGHKGWVNSFGPSDAYLLTINGSDNGLSPGRRQAIIWTNTGVWLIAPLGTIFSEILIEIHTSSFKKLRLKVSSPKCRPFCLGLNVLLISCQCESPTSYIYFDDSWSGIPGLIGYTHHTVVISRNTRQ